MSDAVPGTSGEDGGGGELPHAPELIHGLCNLPGCNLPCMVRLLILHTHSYYAVRMLHRNCVRFK